MTHPEELLISDAIRIDVESYVDSTFNFNPFGDVIVISAIFDSAHSELEFIQVRNLDWFISQLWTRNKNELYDDFRLRVQADPLFKAVGAMWAVGARNILVVKAANTSDIPATTTAARYDFIYSKTKAALEYATQFDFVGLICSVEAQYQLVVDDVVSTEVLNVTQGSTVLTISDDTKVAYSNFELNYGDGPLLNTDYTLYAFDNIIDVPNIDPAGYYYVNYYKCWDFMTLMANVCAKAISNGNIIQSIVSAPENSVTNILNNETLYRKYAWQQLYCKTTINGITKWVPNNDKYRFVSVAVGTANISIGYNGFIFQDGLGAVVTGLMSILDDDIAVSGRIIKAVRMLYEPTQGEADNLSNNGFIPIGGTVRTRRGLADESRPLADSNMGVVRSELRQTGVLRLTRRIAYNIKRSLQKHIGTYGDGIKDSVKEVMDGYKKRGIVRRYSYRISRPPKDPHKVLILIQFLPYFSAKVIEVSIVAGANIQ